MFTVWFQVLNKDGSVNNEDIKATTSTLEDAVKRADEGDVIRYIEEYKDGDDFWEVYDRVGDYIEYDSEGNKR